jgi:hypothetical protein
MDTRQDWQYIDSTNPNKGQFKLASYEPSPRNQSGLGVVKMDGRVGQNAQGKDDIQTGKGKSEGEIAYDPGLPAQPGLPARKVAATDGLAFVGIWLSEGNVADSNYFVANALLENKHTSSLYGSLSATSKHESGRGDEAATTSLKIRDFLPDQPAAFANSNQLANKALIGNGNNKKVTLPQNGDVFTPETINGVETKVYRYYAQGLTKNLLIQTVNSAAPTSGSATQTPTKVLLYVDGDIDMDGGAEVTHTCTTTQGASATGSCDLSNFQIYGYKTATNLNPKVCVHGNHKVEAFIIAPDHTAGMKGGGNDGGIDVALWAKSWGEACGSSANKPGLEQKGTAWDAITPYLKPQPAKTIAATPAIPAIPPKVGRTLTSIASNTNTVAATDKVATDSTATDKAAADKAVADKAAADAAANCVKAGNSGNCKKNK